MIASPTSDAAGVADILEIQDLTARYVYLMDSKRFDGWVDLFTVDCGYVVHGRVFQGHEGLREMIGLAAPQGSHIVSPPTVRVSADRATGAQTFIRIGSDKTNFRSGWYEDEFAKVDGRWLFSVRACSFVRSDGSIRPPR